MKPWIVHVLFTVRTTCPEGVVKGAMQGSTLLFSSLKAAVKCTLLVLCVSSVLDVHSSLVGRFFRLPTSIPQK